MTKKEIKIKEKLLIKNIKALAQELEKTPTKKDYLEKYGNPQFENVGGFSKILEKAGFIRNRHINLSNEEIKKMFLDYIKENDIPISHKFPKILPSYDLICDRFGSYKKFLNLIGYNTLEKSYTKDEIITLLRKGIDTGEIKSILDLNKSGYPVPSTIYKMLKVRNWKETLILIDRKLETNYKKVSKYNYTKKELKKMFLDLSRKLNKTKRGASKYDIKKHLGITQDVFQRVFNKNLTELKKEWGFQVIERKKYTKANISKILKKKIKEKGKKLTIKEIKIAKDIPALSTIFRIFNTTSIKKIYLEIEKGEE